MKAKDRLIALKLLKTGNDRPGIMKDLGITVTMMERPNVVKLNTTKARGSFEKGEII